MPWHHVIPKHEWKKRFGNLVGVNAIDNMVNLSLKNHIQLHERMGEEGSKFDRIAASGMTGLIDKEHLLKELQQECGRKTGLRNKGMVRTEVFKLNLSVYMNGKRYSLGRIRPEKEKYDISNSMVGKKNSLGIKRSEKFRRQISAFHKGLAKPQPHVTCVHCGTNGGANVMKRWHFNNCGRHYAT